MSEVRENDIHVKTLFGRTVKVDNDKGLMSENIFQIMLANAAGYLEDMPERAFDTYKRIVELIPEITA